MVDNIGVDYTAWLYDVLIYTLNKSQNQELVDDVLVYAGSSLTDFIRYANTQEVNE